MVGLELHYTLSVVFNLVWATIQLLPVLISPNIDRLLLSSGETFVDFLCNLELEGEGDARFCGKFISIFRRVVVIIKCCRGLLLLPTCENDLSETRIPGIRAICLSRRQLPLGVKVEFQVPSSHLRVVDPTATIVEPVFDFLDKG